MMQKQRRIWNLTGWKEAAWIFAVSRVLILFLTYEGVSRFPPELSGQRLDCSMNHKACVLSWWHWDVVHYINIAQNGYNPPYETAFFPLWPFLIRIVGLIFGGSATADYFASLLLANICFFFALVVLYYLINEDFEPSIARNTLFFLTFSPVALFFFAGYTESLTLLFSVLLFFFLRRASGGSSPWNWWLAGLCGFLALLGHASSIILVVPFSVVFLRYVWQHWWKATEGKLRWWQILNALLPILLIPASILVYMAYLYLTKGNPLLFREVELSEWHRYTTWHIWQGTVDTIKTIFTPTPQSSINIMDLVFTYIPIIALIIGWKRLPLHYNLFALTGILFFLMTPSGQIWSLSSGPRYELVLFPLTLLFAIWSKYPRWEKVFLAYSIAAFTLHLLFFVTARWAG